MTEKGRLPRRATNPSEGPRDHAKRIAALTSLLVDKGVVTREKIREAIEAIESETFALGTKAVARAWKDPAFKARLLQDTKKAFGELGIDISSERIVALENTEKVHNLIVCTLCSCYPRAVLGTPPAWYKSLEYRSRAVSDPRGVLEEFGLRLDPKIEVRVYDSTADIRYVVIPKRPPGSEDLTEEELSKLVTRDSMIGTGEARFPA